MAKEEVHDIVIVGGGICGLALSLGLHRRGMRCLRRKDLIETLGRYIPAEQMRFGCHVSTVDFDPITNLHVVTTRNDTTIKAKVLIGCDGSYSIISKSLNLTPPKFFPMWITRGITTYPEGHDFENHFLRMVTPNGAYFGCQPIDNKTIHFFVAHSDDPAGDMNEPNFIKEYATKLLKGTPNKITNAVKNCDMDTLNMKHMGYRSLWSILNQDFRRGTLVVAGDAMHQMGPFIGQGGSLALEDAIVLTRYLSNVINALTDTSYDKKWIKRVEDALDLYINERRPRLMKLALQSYLVGTLASTKSLITKLVAGFLVGVFFGGNKSDPTLFDCGTI
ncbi:hypothetical protein LUZ60_017752 [Juncus effusus]|nr:hypothetical protein LUZ60_017752 [Juncus effusus]